MLDPPVDPEDSKDPFKVLASNSPGAMSRVGAASCSPSGFDPLAVAADFCVSFSTRPVDEDFVLWARVL